MDQPFQVAPDISVLPSQLAIPGLGHLAMNAFVLHAREPVLVDAGLHADGEAFMAALRSTIDPQDLRWIWLTHIDQDHVGSLQRVLQVAPKARIVTNFLGAGKLGLTSPVAPDRLYFLNPGQTLDVGDRMLTAVRPPVYDAPETIALHDPKSGALFSSDCFGAVLPSLPVRADDLPQRALAEGQTLWATIDAPWVHHIDRAVHARGCAALRELAPSMVLSSHLPPAIGMLDRLLETLLEAPRAAPFVGPDQRAFEALLRQAA